MVSQQHANARQEALLAYAVLRHALQAYEQPPVDLPKSQCDEIRVKVERELVIQDAVLNSSMAPSIGVADAEVATAVAELQGRYDCRKDFLNDLARNGLDMPGLEAALARELRVAAVLERVGEAAPDVTDAEVRDYYERHSEKFAYPETREARHILITINDDYPENSREMARVRIERIVVEIDGKPGRFVGLAAKHSECPTAMQQGQLGRVRAGQLYPELDTTLFAMKEGDISRPIETEIGFHLLYCERVYPPGEAEFGQVEGKIREFLQQAHVRKCQRNWLAELDI